jgi:hypothetical protein
MKMKLSSIYSVVVVFASAASATILQNGQVRITDYPKTVIESTVYAFETYPPSAHEISYKGRWDSKYISWWS